MPSAVQLSHRAFCFFVMRDYRKPGLFNQQTGTHRQPHETDDSCRKAEERNYFEWDVKACGCEARSHYGH